MEGIMDVGYHKSRIYVAVLDYPLLEQAIFGPRSNMTWYKQNISTPAGRRHRGVTINYCPQ